MVLIKPYRKKRGKSSATEKEKKKSGKGRNNRSKR